MAWLGGTAAVIALALASAAGTANEIYGHKRRYDKDGTMPWDDLGETGKMHLGAQPVLGPVLDAAQGRKDWGDAALQSGMTVASVLGGPALGALGSALAPVSTIGNAAVGAAPFAGAIADAGAAGLAGSGSTVLGGAAGNLAQLGSMGTKAAEAGAASVGSLADAGAAVSSEVTQAALGGGEAATAQKVAQALGVPEGAPQRAMGPPTSGEHKLLGMLEGSSLQDKADPMGQVRTLSKEAQPEFIGPRDPLSTAVRGMNTPFKVSTPKTQFQDFYAKPFEALGEYTHPDVGKAAGRITSNAISGAISNPDDPGEGALRSGIMGLAGAAGAGLGSRLGDAAFGQGPIGIRLPKTDVGSAYMKGQMVGATIGGEAGKVANKEMTRRPPPPPKAFEPADLMQAHQMMYSPSNIVQESYTPFRQRRLM